MLLEEPRWWYEKTPKWSSRLLAPVGALYGRVAELRFRRTAPYIPRMPVLCVGNFTAGGTGKTPMAIALAQIVRDLGREPVFLSRGYGGRLRGPIIVDPQHHTHMNTGDEPLLLAHVAPAVIAQNRREGAELIERTYGSNAIIIMDDGLQNPALKKDFSIAVVDGNRGFGNGLCIPAGPLRAPLRFQAGLVQAIAINSAIHGADANSVFAPVSGFFSGAIIKTRVTPASELAWLRGKKIVAFAGIANPDRFFALVEANGGVIAERLTFPDHHAFTEADALRLISAADVHQATLVTTEKDFVRLKAGGRALHTLAERTRAVPVILVFEGDGRSQLTALISAAIQRRSSARQP